MTPFSNWMVNTISVFTDVSICRLNSGEELGLIKSTDAGAVNGVKRAQFTTFLQVSHD